MDDYLLVYHINIGNSMIETTCLKCQQNFLVKLYDINRGLGKFCSKSCSTSYYNQQRADLKPKQHCKHCDAVLKGRKSFCSNKCQGQYSKETTIQKWKSGQLTGITEKTGTVVGWLKNYLREKYGNKCCMCGWNKVNPYTGRVPLVADHIDGDHQNNAEENLRLICWNCDALGPTFGARNKGKGRKNRYDKSRQF
jgi:predicted nucleic acid-binding Zn ribbon protein